MHIQSDKPDLSTIIIIDESKLDTLLSQQLLDSRLVGFYVRIIEHTKDLLRTDYNKTQIIEKISYDIILPSRMFIRRIIGFTTTASDLKSVNELWDVIVQSVDAIYTRYASISSTRLSERDKGIINAMTRRTQEYVHSISAELVDISTTVYPKYDVNVQRSIFSRIQPSLDLASSIISNAQYI